jgi:hypothetical protein
MPKRGKRYLEAIKLVNRETLYTPEDAIDLVKKTSTVKFNATVEAHLRMGLDPRKADQLVRSTVQLPHGTGKPVCWFLLRVMDKKQLWMLGLILRVAMTWCRKFKAVGLILMSQWLHLG